MFCVALHFSLSVCHLFRTLLPSTEFAGKFFSSLFKSLLDRAFLVFYGAPGDAMEGLCYLGDKKIKFVSVSGLERSHPHEPILVVLGLVAGPPFVAFFMVLSTMCGLCHFVH